MRLSTANKILLGSCVVVVPCMYPFDRAELISVSIYGGTLLKERYLASELEKVSPLEIRERHSRARIVE
jgi:hypothetical protein